MYRLCRVREISPGTHTFFHTYTCPVYCWRSVQLLDFGLLRSLIHASQPVRDFCSSGQCFASGFLQTHTSRRRPCLWLHPSHCRADQGLSPFRTCARRAHVERPSGRIQMVFLWTYAPSQPGTLLLLLCLKLLDISLAVIEEKEDYEHCRGHDCRDPSI